MRFHTKLAVFLFALIPAAAQTGPVVLKSPNGALEISFSVRKGDAAAEMGQLAYSITFQSKPLFDWSALGLVLQGAPPLGAQVRIVSAQPSSEDETWSAPHGKANPIRNHYNAVAIQVRESGDRGRAFAVEARAYDDGVAFRYVVPAQPGIRSLEVASRRHEVHPLQGRHHLPADPARTTAPATRTTTTNSRSAPCIRITWWRCRC